MPSRIYRINVDKRGRPPKSDEEKKSEHVQVKIRPSQKKIYSQEAERCGTTMSDVIRQHGFEEMEPQGKGAPIAGVFMEVLSIAEELYEKAQTVEAGRLDTELMNARVELTLRKMALEEAKKKRDRLRRQMELERMSAQVRIRVTKRRKEWLEARAGYAGIPVSTLLREKASEGFRKREKIKRGIIWVDRWADLIEPLLERDCRREETAIREEMERIAKEIDSRIMTDVIREVELL